MTTFCRVGQGDAEVNLTVMGEGRKADCVLTYGNVVYHCFSRWELLTHAEKLRGLGVGIPDAALTSLRYHADAYEGPR